MRQFICIILLLLLKPYSLSAQETDAFKYINGNELTVSGRPVLADSTGYHRISPAHSSDLPIRVQELAKHSAGISLSFQTNSSSIRVNWQLDEYKTLWNMTPLAVNGLDLYGWNGEEWQYVSSAGPSDISNSATFISNLDGRMRHYKVYLPLYTELEEIQIGVEEASVIKPAEQAYMPSKKVVIYGSSITQGASASRPGMAYPSVLSRTLNVETFNLGFSGSGKMEVEVADVIGQMPADLIILDCVPNPSPEQINERTITFVKRLRDLKPQTPILMMESIFRQNGHWDTTVGKKVNLQNSTFQEAYDQLVQEGFDQLYYMPIGELTNSLHDITVDGTHLSSLGHFFISKKVGDYIGGILSPGSDNNNGNVTDPHSN